MEKSDPVEVNSAVPLASKNELLSYFSNLPGITDNSALADQVKGLIGSLSEDRPGFDIPPPTFAQVLPPSLSEIRT